MKKIIHKLIPFTLALALIFVFGVNASAETSQQADTAAEMNSAEEAAALLENIRGTYEPLFPIITRPEYDQLWLDPCIVWINPETGTIYRWLLRSAFCISAVRSIIPFEPDYRQEAFRCARRWAGRYKNSFFMM